MSCRMNAVGVDVLDVRRGGALVESMPVDRRVVGSNPALVLYSCSASACKLRHSVNCCGRERF